MQGNVCEDLHITKSVQTYIYSFMELLSLTQVISKYLMEVDDIELRFELATQAQIFDIGIEVSIRSWNTLTTGALCLQL